MAGLQIARKTGQSFSAFIGDVEVRVILEEIRGPKVAVLRIIAPKSVEILRDELIREGDDGRVQTGRRDDRSLVIKQVVPKQKG